jgi:hypothetical protein
VPCARGARPVTEEKERGREAVQSGGCALLQLECGCGNQGIDLHRREGLEWARVAAMPPWPSRVGGNRLGGVHVDAELERPRERAKLGVWSEREQQRGTEQMPARWAHGSREERGEG